MSSQGIKIRKISLLNFRGAKNLLDLDFGKNCKSCAIFGNNAQGKSTITQAFEWFLRGKIAYLKGEGISDDDVINLAAKDQDETIVNIVFNNPKLNSSRIYDKKAGKARFTNTSSEFSDYIDNKAIYDRIYLDQHTIIWFLAKTKGQKKDEIAKIVGFEEIVKVKSTISSELNELVKSPDLREAKRNLAYNQGLMTKDIYGESIDTVQNLLERSQEFLKVIGIEEKQTNIEQLEKTIDTAIQYLPSQERTKERIELENLKEKISGLVEKKSFIPVLQDWISSFNTLVKDRDNVSKLNMDEFLRQAEIVLKDNLDLEFCPLCEQDIESHDRLLESVVDRYRKLIKIREELQELSEDFTTISQEVLQFKKDSDDFLSKLTIKKIPVKASVIQSSLDIVNKSISEIEDQYNKRDVIPTDFEKLDGAVENLYHSFSNTIQDLSKRITDLALTKEEEEKQKAYRKLLKGKDLFEENLKYQKRIKAYETLINNLERVESQLLDLQNTVMQQVLDSISDDVNKYFCYLNKKERIKNVRLELKGEEGIEFFLDFYDTEASPPRKYLSESQLNSLGIAFFLAAVKKFNRTNKFFILDDVLVSFDRNYRLRLLELLEEEFSEYQKLLLTHEEYWYHMMKKKFPSWILKEVNWDFYSGIRFKGSDFDQLENIRIKHEKGEKVGNELRTYLESLLKDICISLEVKLAFRFGLENERRMIGEMFPALTSTLNRHKSNLQESKEYKDLEVSNFVVTCSSHHNPDLDSFGDMDETIEKAARFRSLFVCSKNRYVEKAFAVPGKKKIACKCGCLEITWS